MIRVSDIEVFNFEGAIRGMRNPMNSWDKSDSIFGCSKNYEKDCLNPKEYLLCEDCPRIFIGENDLELMQKLFKAGTEHRKFMRQIFVSMDITAPFYWWKEADTYAIGVTKNSCSTMHKIHEKEFALDDFSHEHLDDDSLDLLEQIISNLNECRNLYVYGDSCEFYVIKPKGKEYWWQMIQLLPSSYNQKRTVTMNYENAASMIKQRGNHKLDEWRDFVKVLKDLPYMKQIMMIEE